MIKEWIYLISLCLLSNALPEAGDEDIVTTLANMTESSYSSSTTSPKKDPFNENLILIVSVCVTVVLVIICCCVGWVFLLRIKYRTVIQRSKIIQRLRSEGHGGRLVDINNYTDLALITTVPRDEWEIQPVNLVVLEKEKLGSGAFAWVFKGLLKGTAPIVAIHGSLHLALEMHDSAVNEVAVKMLPPHADEANIRDFLAEIDFIKRLGYHGHVLNMLGCISDTRNPLLVTEFCAHGDLLKLLRTTKPNFDKAVDKKEPGEIYLQKKDLVSIAWQVSDAMAFLSSKNYIHRDVAARNVLITGKLVAKVSDFGLCRYNDQALYTTRGGRLPIKWMSIESLRLMEYTTKSDVWSYGVFLYELYTFGETPYIAIQPTEMLQYLDEGNRLTPPELANEQIASIMQNCWETSPDARATFEEIRQKLTYLLDIGSDNYGYLQVTREMSVMSGSMDEERL